MTRKMGIRWHLRLRMAEKGMFQTSDLVPLLAERGVHLSREQVYRMVTQVPQRLSTDTLAALCDILGCQPNDLIEVEVVSQQVRKAASESSRVTPPPGTAQHDPPPRFVVTTAQRAGPVRERVIAHLAAILPDLDARTAHDVLVAARVSEGRALRELDAYFRVHPGALAATPAEFPLALVRVAHALKEAGHRSAALPVCAGCGKITPDLRRKTADGRVCATCAASRSTGTCARCGQVKRINARRDEGGICSACYAKDEQVLEDCSGCGRRRRPAARMPDGRARCQSCATRQARTCSACGQPRTVAGTTDAGPVCASCYQQPQRPCGRCGRLRKIAKRAIADSPDLCYGCYKGASAVCSVCGETRPCQRISSGSPICRRCRTRPPRPCFRCSRSRPVQAEWPIGPVCVGCYEHVRRHPASCALCQVVRPLIGSDEHGELICGPCAGAPGLDYTCRECGRSGKIHSDRRCYRCVLAGRARALLSDPGGEVSPQLQPLLAAFSTVSNPATVVDWLGKAGQRTCSADWPSPACPSPTACSTNCLKPTPCTTSGKYWSALASYPRATSTWSA